MAFRDDFLKISTASVFTIAAFSGMGFLASTVLAGSYALILATAYALHDNPNRGHRVVHQRHFVPNAAGPAVPPPVHVRHRFGWANPFNWGWGHHGVVHQRQHVRVPPPAAHHPVPPVHANPGAGRAYVPGRDAQRGPRVQQHQPGNGPGPNQPRATRVVHRPG